MQPIHTSSVTTIVDGGQKQRAKNVNIKLHKVRFHCVDTQVHTKVSVADVKSDCKLIEIDLL